MPRIISNQVEGSGIAGTTGAGSVGVVPGGIGGGGGVPPAPGPGPGPAAIGTKAPMGDPPKLPPGTEPPMNGAPGEPVTGALEPGTIPSFRPNGLGTVRMGLSDATAGEPTGPPSPLSGNAPTLLPRRWNAGRDAVDRAANRRGAPSDNKPRTVITLGAAPSFGSWAANANGSASNNSPRWSISMMDRPSMKTASTLNS